MHVLATPVASVGHSARATSRDSRSAAVVAQEVQRIVLRDADQRETERKRDAVHRAEQGRHCGEPGETRRSAAASALSRHGANTAIGDQQEGDHPDRCRKTELPRLRRACVPP